jgi:hypothetical protein
MSLGGFNGAAGGNSGLRPAEVDNLVDEYFNAIFEIYFLQSQNGAKGITIQEFTQGKSNLKNKPEILKNN